MTLYQHPDGGPGGFTKDEIRRPDWKYCIYCQKQYKFRKNFARHIRLQHNGTYAYWRVLTQEERDEG